MPSMRSLKWSLHGGLAELLHAGESSLSGRQLLAVERMAVSLTIVTTNVGAFAAVAIAGFVVPMPALADLAHLRLVNGLVAAGYVLLAIPFGSAIGFGGLRRLRH